MICHTKQDMQTETNMIENAASVADFGKSETLWEVQLLSAESAMVQVTGKRYRKYV